MEHNRSRLVLIVSDDEGACHALGRCAIRNNASVYVVRERVDEAILALGSWLAAVVVDVHSDSLADSAWRTIEKLRQSASTASTPIVLRYDRGHVFSSSLMLGLDPIHGIEAERGVDAACEALAAALGNRAAWPIANTRHLMPG